MQMTWWRAASWPSFRAMNSAVLPPMPASISSKIEGLEALLVLARRLEGQHHPRQLAAGGDPPQGPELLARIGREQELDVLGPLIADGRGIVGGGRPGLEPDLEPGLGHAEEGDLLFDGPAEPGRGLLALGAQAGGEPGRTSRTSLPMRASSSWSRSRPDSSPALSRRRPSPWARTASIVPPYLRLSFSMTLRRSSIVLGVLRRAGPPVPEADERIGGVLEQDGGVLEPCRGTRRTTAS